MFSWELMDCTDTTVWARCHAGHCSSLVLQLGR